MLFDNLRTRCSTTHCLLLSWCGLDQLDVLDQFQTCSEMPDVYLQLHELI